MGSSIAIGDWQETPDAGGLKNHTGKKDFSIIFFEARKATRKNGIMFE